MKAKQRLSIQRDIVTIHLESLQDMVLSVYNKKKGNFIFDQSRVPNFNVPDLEGFEVTPFSSKKQLRPFVSYKVPQIDTELVQKMRELNDWTKQENLNRKFESKQK